VTFGNTLKTLLDNRSKKMIKGVRCIAQYHSAIFVHAGYSSDGEILVKDYYTRKVTLPLKTACAILSNYYVDWHLITIEEIMIPIDWPLPGNRVPNEDATSVSYQLTANKSKLSSKTVIDGQSIDWAPAGSIKVLANDCKVINCNFIGNNSVAINFSGNNGYVGNCYFYDCTRRTEDVGYIYFSGRNGQSNGTVDKCLLLGTVIKPIKFSGGGPNGFHSHGVQFDDNFNGGVVKETTFVNIDCAITVNGGTNTTVIGCNFIGCNKILYLIGHGKVDFVNCTGVTPDKIIQHGGKPMIAIDGVEI